MTISHANSSWTSAFRNDGMTILLMSKSLSSTLLKVFLKNTNQVWSKYDIEFRIYVKVIKK
jgi:hypothetical protein